MDRMLTNLLVADVAKSKEFYIQLLNLNVQFEEDWFVLLADRHFELGIISNASDIVPDIYKKSPAGFYLTFVVSDVDAIFETAKSMKALIIQEPKDEVYGQRRLLVQAPEGVLVDISSPIVMS